MITDSTRQGGGSPVGRFATKRWVPIAAAVTAAALTAGAIATAGGGGAAAATKLPQAQSVGNFLDATLGGNTLDSVAKLKYATAKAPGSASVQNPLDVEVLNAIDLPLTGALQLPSLLGVHLGAVTQKAQANVNGEAYGQAGAALNAGGVSVGGNNSTDQAGAATINLTASGIAGNSGLPIPGGGTADALGGITATVQGVSAVASTPKGYAKPGATAYDIADVTLSLGSPLLGGLLGNVTSTLTTTLNSIITQLTTAAGALAPILPNCSLTSAVAINKPISLEGGAVTIDPSTATITISLEKLLKVLGLNLNTLPANTDLIDYLLAYLADPNGLAKGLQGVVNGLLDPLETQFTNCLGAVNAIPLLGPVLAGLVSTLTSGQTTIENTLTGLVGQIAGAAGVNPLAPLGAALKQLLDIGVNVQPNGKAGPAGAAYVDPLAATPKQGTPVVKDQTIVRAVEVNVAAGAGSSLGAGSLPGLGSLPIGSLTGAKSVAVPNSLKAAATAGSTGIATLALANAAAGPSTAPTTPTTTPTSAAPTTGTPTGTTPRTAVPTGVPAGEGTHGGSPLLPLTLLLLGLMVAGGGVVSYRMRGTLNRH